jgi:hypothetical protein
MEEKQYCEECGEELINGICFNDECASSPYYISEDEENDEDWCELCGDEMIDGYCSNPSCENSEEYNEDNENTEE